MALKYMDGLVGFVVGDAMGTPLKLKTREELLLKPVTKMIGYGTYNLPEGTWSDVTSMLIATIDSINNKNKIDFSDIAFNFIAFKNHASYTAIHEVFSLEKNCDLAITNYDESRLDPLTCGLAENTSGSLMRILPIAYYAIEKKLKDYEVLELVKNISLLTNSGEISIMGCYFYVRYAMFLLNGKDKLSAYSMSKCVDYSMFSEETQEQYKRLIKEDISKLSLKEIKSTDYVVDLLEASMWVLLKSENYKEAIIGAINLGDNTNTVGALTGALAGIVFGIDYIPKEWIDALARKDYLLDIFEEFSENKYDWIK